MKKSFFKKGEKPNFYSMLIAQCQLSAKAMLLLTELMKEKTEETADKIEKCEKDGDQIRKKLINYVENSFITPLDRHDIFAVSRRIDDLTDKVKDLKDYFIFFDITPIDKNIEMAKLIAGSIDHLTDGIIAWSQDNDEDFWTNLVTAKKNENRIKRLYWESIATLKSDTYSIDEILIRKEFYKELNAMANKASRAADRLSDTKIKSIK